MDVNLDVDTSGESQVMSVRMWNSLVWVWNHPADLLDVELSDVELWNPLLWVWMG